MSKYKKKKGAVLLASVLPGVAKEFGWDMRLKQHSIFDHWHEIVDREVHEHATPLKISRNVLWLEVENSAWIQQLQYQKLLILDALNEFIPQTPLDDIRLVVKDQTEPKKKKEMVVRFEAPPSSEIAAFEDMIATISDEKSREALMRFWYLSHACKRDESE